MYGTGDHVRDLYGKYEHLLNCSMTILHKCDKISSIEDSISFSKLGFSLVRRQTP